MTEISLGLIDNSTVMRLRVSPNLDALVRAEAERLGTTKSEFVRQAIKEKVGAPCFLNPGWPRAAPDAEGER